MLLYLFSDCDFILTDGLKWSGSWQWPVVSCWRWKSCSRCLHHLAPNNNIPWFFLHFFDTFQILQTCAFFHIFLRISFFFCVCVCFAFAFCRIFATYQFVNYKKCAKNRCVFFAFLDHFAVVFFCALSIFQTKHKPRWVRDGARVWLMA